MSTGSTQKLLSVVEFPKKPNGYKPIYGLEKLAQSNKPVLIVEGEKTADSASKLLPEFTVISWLGGSVAASRVNWQYLQIGK